MIQITLHDVRIRKMSRVRVRRVDSFAQVDGHDGFGAELRGECSVATLAATALENCPALEECFVDGAEPVEELLPVACGELGIACPLVAERFRGALLHIRLLLREARNAADDGHRATASGA